MAYTSVIPVHRLDRSIEYVKDKEKTTQKADSLEAAIDYAMNRTKTEQAVFEDTIGCTNENAYEDMLTTKKRFHKMGGVEGYHLVQSFAEGEVTPELAHLIGQELADRLLKGQYEVVITTHLNTRHYHNHIVWNSVSMADGRKYHSNAKSYYTEIRKISDELCRKYGLSIIESDQKKSIPYVQWKAEQEAAVKNAQEESAKLAKMNADQKHQYEMEKLQKENAELKRSALRMELGKTATGLLKEHNVDATQDILDFVVGENAEETKERIDRFVSIVQAQLKRAEVERATGRTPKTVHNTGNAMSEIDKRIAKYQ